MGLSSLNGYSALDFNDARWFEFIRTMFTPAPKRLQRTIMVFPIVGSLTLAERVIEFRSASRLVQARLVPLPSLWT